MNLVDGSYDLSFGSLSYPTETNIVKSPLTSKANRMDNRLFLIDPSGGQLSMSGKTITDKVIVLDLDETAVHSFRSMDSYGQLGIDKHPDLKSRAYHLLMNDVVTPHGQGNVTTMWGMKRPHINEFLIFCFSYFRVVIVWSAGKFKYVHSVVDNLFGDIIRPHLTYTWDDCLKVDGVCVKDLTKLYDHPELGKYVRPENTLLIDDKEYSFNMTSPHNGVLIPQYKPNLNLESLRTDDIALLQLQSWFQTPEVMNSKDVRLLDKQKIFTTSLNKATPLPQNIGGYNFPPFGMNSFSGMSGKYMNNKKLIAVI
uniref:Ctd-like (NLI interacting factor-like) phosphatase n=1 Tax=Pithovirus LCPAC202 TaxID=2506592 RepID=A0A481Z6C2_9VIRU|nr:MAG: ctd-like (NLI interacting factor-like) phosphatase [Pithovirus LCPAC202]